MELLNGSPVIASKRVVLRASSDSALNLANGDRVRVLDAHVVTDVEDEAKPLVVTTNIISAIYLVPSRS
jgi:hypothetical protein